jgi:hypothetical protein
MYSGDGGTWKGDVWELLYTVHWGGGGFHFISFDPLGPTLSLQVAEIDCHLSSRNDCSYKT